MNLRLPCSILKLVHLYTILSGPTQEMSIVLKKIYCVHNNTVFVENSSIFTLHITRPCSSSLNHTIAQQHPQHQWQYTHNYCCCLLVLVGWEWGEKWWACYWRTNLNHYYYGCHGNISEFLPDYCHHYHRDCPIVGPPQQRRSIQWMKSTHDKRIQTPIYYSLKFPSIQLLGISTQCPVLWCLWCFQFRWNWKHRSLEHIAEAE